MSYEHCALGPMAPAEEERRAARARDRARTIERLSKSSVKLFYVHQHAREEHAFLRRASRSCSMLISMRERNMHFFEEQ